MRLANGAGGNADDDFSVRYVGDNDRIRSNHHPVAEANSSQDGSTSRDQDVVSERRIIVQPVDR
jgi:hypothetical protein